MIFSRTEPNDYKKAMRWESVFSMQQVELARSRSQKSNFGMMFAAVIVALAAVFLNVFIGQGAGIALILAGVLATLSLLGLLFSKFLLGASRVCRACNGAFSDGDAVTQIMGRSPGQYAAFHTSCYRNDSTE